MASTPKTPKKRVAKKTGPAKQVDKKVEIKEIKEPKEKDKEIKEKDFKDVSKDHKEKPEVKEHKIEVKEAKQENKELKFEGKEHKNEKIEIKEKPEIKEHMKAEKLESKELKIEKIEGKEHGKDGGKIEIKDQKENFKEVIDKNTPENPKDLVEGGGGPVIDPGDPVISAGLAQRVANLEGQLATFISNANRPDLSSGALKNEAPQAGKPKKK
jgi:hypothetical protein